jgi:hypothetical protein
MGTAALGCPAGCPTSRLLCEEVGASHKSTDQHCDIYLAAYQKQADYDHGGGGIDKYRDRGRKSFVVWILTSNIFEI